jgi:hypothetical protein
VEDLSPLLASKAQIEVAEWADTATGEWKLARHALDETRVDEHIATLDLAELAPRLIADVTDPHT